MLVEILTAGFLRRIQYVTHVFRTRPTEELTSVPPCLKGEECEMATVLDRPKARIEVNVSRRKGTEGAWNVEAIDDDGSIEKAIFLGPNAERRARGYAEHQYQT